MLDVCLYFLAKGRVLFIRRLDAFVHFNWASEKILPLLNGEGLSPMKVGDEFSVGLQPKYCTFSRGRDCPCSLVNIDS